MGSEKNVALAKVSSKFQVAIPQKIRRGMRLQAGDHVVYELHDEKATLRRAEAIDMAYYRSLSSTLAEWDSPQDEEAFGEL